MPVVCEGRSLCCGGVGGGRVGVRGEKVLRLNYIVCREETGADRQMAVDKCWGEWEREGLGWGGGLTV